MVRTKRRMCWRMQCWPGHCCVQAGCWVSTITAGVSFLSRNVVRASRSMVSWRHTRADTRKSTVAINCGFKRFAEPTAATRTPLDNQGRLAGFPPIPPFPLFPGTYLTTARRAVAGCSSVGRDLDKPFTFPSIPLVVVGWHHVRRSKCLLSGCLRHSGALQHGQFLQAEQLDLAFEKCLCWAIDGRESFDENTLLSGDGFDHRTEGSESLLDTGDFGGQFDAFGCGFCGGKDGVGDSGDEFFGATDEGIHVICLHGKTPFE